MSKIKVAGPLVMPENTPTRVGEEIDNISEIYDIPAPRVGMRVYVKSEGKEYIIKSLKMKVIEGVEVPDAAVDEYENVDIKDRVQGKSDKNDSRYDMIFIGDFSKDDIEGFNEALDALTYDTSQPGFGYGYFRAMYGYRNVEIVNTLISSGQNTIVQVVRGVLSIKNGLLVSQGDKYISFTRTHTTEGWDKWRMKNISDMFLLADVEEDVNKFIYVGKFSNLNDAYARCAEVGRENPTLSMLKFDVVAGNIYDSLFILQTYNRNESIITQFCLYGEGQKHSCKVRHIVTDGTVDEWQDIQLYTSYSYENNALYGYKYGKGGGVNKVKLFTIPAATTESAGVMTAEDKQKLEAAGNGATKVTWGSASNMNDFRTAGVYDIYGERTNLGDNLPIFNSNPGHSIAAKLTVVDSSLQKADGSAPTEIHLTQFLMLDNRVGPSADMYMRTYTQDNGQANNGTGEWSLWRKFQGIVETYMNTDSMSIGFNNSLNQEYCGLDEMVDNGVYTGIYTDDYNLQNPSFLETFTLIVINNYAVADQDSRLKRTISQLKYAVDAITNQATVKQRIKTDGSGWTDWQEIGGGDNEVDVTDAVKAYGLPTLIAQGFAKEGVTYKVLDFGENAPVVFDSENKIFNKLLSSGITGIEGHWDADIKVINNKIIIDAYGYNETKAGGVSVSYYKFIINQLTNDIVVSADMTTL